MWPTESTNKGTSSVSANPNERRASMGGGTMSHAEKSGVLGISIGQRGWREVWENKGKLKEKGGLWGRVKWFLYPGLQKDKGGKWWKYGIYTFRAKGKKGKVIKVLCLFTYLPLWGKKILRISVENKMFIRVVRIDKMVEMCLQMIAEAIISFSN